MGRLHRALCVCIPILCCIAIFAPTLRHFFLFHGPISALGIGYVVGEWLSYRECVIYYCQMVCCIGFRLSLTILVVRRDNATEEAALDELWWKAWTFILVFASMVSSLTFQWLTIRFALREFFRQVLRQLLLLAQRRQNQPQTQAQHQAIQPLPAPAEQPNVPNPEAAEAEAMLDVIGGDEPIHQHGQDVQIDRPRQDLNQLGQAMPEPRRLHAAEMALQLAEINGDAREREQHLQNAGPDFFERLLQNLGVHRAQDLAIFQDHRPGYHNSLEYRFHPTTLGDVQAGGELVLRAIGHTHRDYVGVIRDQDDMACPICYDTFERGCRVTRLPCGHIFHSACITRAWERKFECALCTRGLEWRLTLRDQQT